MTQILEAWLEGHYAGRFIFGTNQPARFHYDEGAPDTPISLSLPRDGSSSKLAAQRFLDNLLPDADHTRARMARAYEVENPTTYALLAKAGEDLAGGLVLLPEGANLYAGVPRMNPVLSRALANRISSIKQDADAWIPAGAPARFSLAGTQGKFAIADIDGEWYWSNESVPSTHIVKPGAPRLAGIEEAESAALALARRIGVDAASARVLHVEDQQAFIVERFDRVRQSNSVFPRRLHAEDLAQALGIGPTDKYNVTMEQAFRKLSEVDHDGNLRRRFLAQVVFNTLIGNADAHAKNYSLFLRPGQVSLAPLYDAVPVSLYPEYDQNLAMRIAGARQSQAVSLSHWRKLAKRINLDQDEISARVQEIASLVGEHHEGAWSTLAPHQTELLSSAVGRNVEKALRAD
ncbi:HipA domain-containing protein [Paeniglutamicibacter sp.]|uniref:HipA domain-containing protein n=1 Tax=Paeniglutamicibacter sp. TaxID=1934391 RepID=UPI0039896605